MKTTFFKSSSALVAAAALTFLAGTTVRADYKSTVLADSPVSYHRFGESVVTGGGYPVFINAGTNGAAANGVMTWVQFRAPGNTNLGLATIACGQPGALNDPANTALKFYGNMSNAVEVPYGPGISPSGSGGFSAEIWVKGANVYGIPISMSDYAVYSGTTAGTGGWYISQNDSNLKGPTGFYFRAYIGGTRTGPNLNMTVDPNAWYHIVGVYDGAHLLLYTNGALAGSTAISGAYTPPSTQQPLRFGQRADGTYAYDGLLDEPAFYQYALTPAQIAAHYAAATTNGTGYAAQILADHPAGYWRFNETFTPPVAQNSSAAGASFNGAYYGSSTTALGLDGPIFPGLESNNRVLQVTTNALSGVVIPSLNFTTNTVTFECLIKPNADQVDGSGNPTLAGVVMHRNQLRRSNACGINFASATTLGYSWNVGNVNGNNTVASTDFALTPPEGSWSYVALAISPTTATMYLYDGTNWSSAVDSLTTSFAVQTFDGYTCVGFDYAPTHNFNGSIDEVAIYNTTLSEGQLHTHALAAFGGLGAPVLVTSATVPVQQAPPASNPTIYQGTPFTLAIEAIGAGLAYQWEISPDLSTWSNIPGATNSTYVNLNPGHADTGYYSVIITNANGTVTSDTLYVFVNTATFPSVGQPLPAARSVYPGGNASFTASSATGGGLAYQWQHAGTNLPGATVSTLTLTNVNVGNAGNYAVVVTNAAGSITSSPPVTLSVAAPTPGTYESAVIADAPEGYWRLQDTGASLTIFDSMGRHDGVCNRTTSQSTNGLSFLQPGALAGESCYSMYFDGVNHVNYGVDVPWSPALNAPIFSAECWVLMGDTNYYAVSTHGMGCMGCRDDNGDCAQRSRGWYFVYVNPASQSVWSDYMAIGGENGTGALDGGQWSQNWCSTTVFFNSYANWTHLACTYDGTINRLYVNGVLASSNTGDFAQSLYRDLYIGSGDAYVQTFPGTQWTGNIEEAAYYQQALSAARVLAHYQLGRYGSTNLPIIAVPPASQTVQSGAAAAFNPVVVGAATITYQWKLYGTNLPGATNLNLSFASANLTNAGPYTLAATNSFGGVLSPAATLTVLSPSTITVTYQIVAGGGGSQSLQINYAAGNLYSATNVAGPWTAVSGATAPSYTAPINPATPSMFFRVK